MHMFWGVTGAVFSKKKKSMLHNASDESQCRSWAVEQNMLYPRAKMFISNKKFSEYK